MANKLQLSTAGVGYVQTGTFMDIMTPMAKRKVTIEEAEPETEIGKLLLAWMNQRLPRSPQKSSKVHQMSL